MGEAEKLIVGIIGAIIVLVLGFFVIKSIFPKKATTPSITNSQTTPTPTPSLINTTPTPTTGSMQGSGGSLAQPSNGTNTTGYQVIQSQNGSSSGQGNQSQSQSGSGQTQTQTLPNGMTQTQSQ